MQRVGRILYEVIQLPGVPDSPWRARRFIREALTGLPDTVVETVQLLISELVTNAVVHGSPPVRVEVDIAPSSVSATVTDQGPGAPVLHEQAALDEHGRGLQLVRQLADDWGVEWRTGGKSVWFRLRTGGGFDLVHELMWTG